ncbi:MAG: helix-turn-helix transcriptional regulator [Dehalococcoidales bacterium]|nr:helix-turn-helix transcriptional regulator [Dehalococcoidales bacterium]
MGKNTGNWEKINAVKRMQECIEKHIAEPITLRMIARAAGYSPWHSARIFKELTGKTLFDYIRALRLSRAAVKLQNGNSRIVDVAFDFVFESHEGFTRAFSRQFGMSPRHYRRDAPHVRLFMPAHIRDSYHKIYIGEGNMSEKSNVNTVFVQVVDRPARKLILKRGVKADNYFAYCEEVGCEIWDVLTGIKDALYEPIGMWLPQNLRKPGTSIYAQGVEMPADYSSNVPEGLEVIDLPSCKMMVFQGQPYEDSNFMEAISDLWEIMKSYNPEIYGFAWADEDGPRFQLEPQGYRGYIEARPVRQLNVK